jgi:hypothetical protein
MWYDDWRGGNCGWETRDGALWTPTVGDVYAGIVNAHDMEDVMREGARRRWHVVWVVMGVGVQMD